MGMDLKGIVEQMIQSGAFSRVVNDPRAQFGVPARNYLGATLLPEVTKPINDFTEENIQYRTIIANAGTRYSPVQVKGGVISGSFKVSLGYSDTGSQITGADYDALLRLVQYSQGAIAPGGAPLPTPPMAAMQTQLFNWVDMTLNRPLLEHNEVNRWQAIVDASVVLTGDNGYTETVSYPNPANSRVAQGGQWSSSAYDPWADIMAGAEFLATKGWTVNRIITSTSVKSKLVLNTKILNRISRIRWDVAGAAAAIQNPGRAQLSQLNALLGDDGLPPMELYDLQYRTSTGSGYFLKRDVFVMVATTGRDRSIDLADLQPLGNLQNTLGYTAIGVPAGQPVPGRVIKTRVIDDSKPPRIEGEGWQASLPVLTDPEAIFVITGIT